jgi:hypothetical protein
MLHNLIMSGRIGKWAYALIEYDLAYEPLKYMSGQVVVYFIVEHWINDTHKLDISYLTVSPWTLYFDGSVCNEGQGIGIVFVSPSNVSFDFSSRLKTYLSAFRPRGVPGPTSELSPHVPAQMGRRETKHEGGGEETGKGETLGLRVALRPGRVRLQ